MTIKNNILISLDQTDKHLFIPKTVVGAEYAIADLYLVKGFDSITVEEGNEHFYMQDGCLIWRDKKAVMLTVKGAKIPQDEEVEEIASGAFMSNGTLEEVEIPKNIKRIAYNAFADTGVHKVCLNEGLEILDLYAFGYNQALKELTIPKSVRRLLAHEVLEVATALCEYGYKNKTYRVYKNTYAHRYMQSHGLKYEAMEG